MKRFTPPHITPPRHSGAAAAALWVAAALLALGAGWWQAMAPIIKEDVNFGEMLRYFNGGSRDFSAAALEAFYRCQRMVDNGRLANVWSPLVALYLPAWLRGAIAGMSLAATYLFMVLTARHTAEESRAGGLTDSGKNGYAADTLMYTAAAAGGFLILPFRDNMVVMDYVLNYILSSALCMAFCFGAVRALGTAPMGRGAVAAVCAAGFFGAANHDGYALPMLAAFGCYALLWRRLRLPLRCWLMGVALLAGALIPVTAPAEWHRAATSAGGTPVAESLRGLLRFGPALYMLPAAIAALLPWRAGRRWLRRLLVGEPAGALMALLWLFSVALFLPFGMAPRQGWLPGCAAIAWLMLLCRGPLARLPRAALWGAAALCMGAAMGICAIGGRWQRVLSAREAEIAAALQASPTGTAFIDRIDPRDMPWISLGRMANDRGNLSVTYGPLNLNAPAGKTYIVVPADVARYTPAAGRRVPGTCGMVVFGDHLLLDSVPWPDGAGHSAGGYSEAWLDIRYTLAGGAALTTRHRAYRFPSPADGSPMAYVITDGTPAPRAIERADLLEAEPFPHQTGGER